MHPNVVVSAEGITELLKETKRIAVLGIKTEAQSDQPAFYVPKYCVDGGFDVVPVPVYYPEAVEILGRPVVRRLADVSPPADMINVFRRSKDLAAHVDDILAAKPKSVHSFPTRRSSDLLEERRVGKECTLFRKSVV